MASIPASVGAGSAEVPISRIDGGEPASALDAVAIEEPLEIRLGCSTPPGRAAKSISITMRTPGNDFELAAGFLFGEGIIGDRRDIRGIEHCGPPLPGKALRNVVRVELDDDVTVDLERLERHFYTTSSCGVCGKTSLEALKVQARFPMIAAVPLFGRGALAAWPARLRERQRIFGATGGLHAAGLFDRDGELIDVREDVGRHNALDKLIGAALLAGRLPLDGHGILVSGRASFELMQKAMMAGCPLLAAVGAPSSLAVELAREFGMTLVGFLRRDRFNVYAGEVRITGLNA